MARGARLGGRALLGFPLSDAARAKPVPARVRLSVLRLFYQAASGTAFALLACISTFRSQSEFAGLQLRNFNMGRCPWPPQYTTGFVYTDARLATGAAFVLDSGSTQNATVIVLTDLPPVSRVEWSFGAAYAMFSFKGLLAPATAATHMHLLLAPFAAIGDSARPPRLARVTLALSGGMLVLSNYVFAAMLPWLFADLTQLYALPSALATHGSAWSACQPWAEQTISRTRSDAFSERIAFSLQSTSQASNVFRTMAQACASLLISLAVLALLPVLRKPRDQWTCCQRAAVVYVLINLLVLAPCTAAFSNLTFERFLNFDLRVSFSWPALRAPFVQRISFVESFCLVVVVLLTAAAGCLLGRCQRGPDQKQQARGDMQGDVEVAQVRHLKHTEGPA